MYLKLKKCAAALLAACLLGGCGARGETFARTSYHMDTFFSYTLSGPDAEAVYDALEACAGRCEALFDRFDARSELSRVNAAAGGAPVQVSAECYALLAQAKAYSLESGGAFDLTVGALTALWGFGTDTPAVPSAEALAAALPLVHADGLTLTEEGGRYYATLEAEQQLDLGGIAKGYALACMREILDGSGLRWAMLSAGGNALLWGERAGGFSVGIRRPSRDAADSVCALQLGAGAVVATTGSYERVFTEDGARYCHVLDPKTGQSVMTELVSLSVVCADATEADYLSTCWFVRGLGAVQAAMEAGELDAVALTEAGDIYVSASLRDALLPERTADGWSVTFVGGGDA